VFYYLYLFLAILLYIIAIPFLIVLSFKTKYRQSIPARFFLFNNKSFTNNNIVFHICSFGEAKAIKPIVDALPKNRLNFSAITHTGFGVIKSYSKEAKYLPYEAFLPYWVTKQKALVVVEAELWYMLFAVYKKKGAKTFLINARISSKSYPKYLKFRWLYKHIFANIDTIYAQSQEDAKKLASLGAKNIKVNGNIKFFNLPDATKKYNKNYKLVVTAASTHESEEEPILNAFLKLKAKEPNSQLIVVPRHPERFKKVASLLQEKAKLHNLTFELFSTTQELKSDIVLIDTLGELVNIYAITDIVILGGAFAKIGGHNAAEAAKFGCKIISGEHYFNQKDIFKAIKEIKIVNQNQLNDVLLNYKELKKCTISSNAEINDIIKELKSVL